MKTRDLNKSLIGKRVKGVFLAMPVTGTIIDLVECVDFVSKEICAKGVKIRLDRPVVDGTGTYTEYESTARVFDDWGNLEYTELIEEKSIIGRDTKKAIEDMIAKGVERAEVVKSVVDMGVEAAMAEFIVSLYARKFNK